MFLRFGKTSVLGKWLEGPAGTRLCGSPLLSIPRLAGPCRRPLLSTSRCSPLLQQPRPRSWGGAHWEPLCSAPPPAHSLGGMTGTGLAAEMPWGSCHLGQSGSRHFVPDTGPPSRATPHPAAPVQTGNVPGIHQGWRECGASVCPEYQSCSPTMPPFLSNPQPPLPLCQHPCGTTDTFFADRKSVV